MGTEILNYKRVLVVDDEPDVLESLEDALPMCDVVKATSFEEAKRIIENEYLDMAVLDIMGVNGYGLLEIAKQKGVPAVMLTANALSPEETARSFDKGAALYVPKEKLNDMPVYLSDVLEARSKGKNFWWRWLDRFGAYYNKRFGLDWKDGIRDFREKFQGWQ